MRRLTWCLILMLALWSQGANAAPSGARGGSSFILDAPNGSAQGSTVLRRLREGDRFSLYITPLRQHLGDSVYATEIQVRLGPVGVAFARMDPTILNASIQDPNKLPPLWEMRQIIGQEARPIEDPRTMSLGAAAISLEDGHSSLLQGVFRGGVLHLAWRPTPRSTAIPLGRFRVGARELAVSTRVIGYRARFTIP